MAREDLYQLERVLKALSNKRRLAILRFLRMQKRASVGEVAEHIRLSFKATSRHLSVLESADIVASEQEGLFVYYRVNSALHRAAQHIVSIL